jgi:hypothetical protein
MGVGQGRASAQTRARRAGRPAARGGSRSRPARACMTTLGTRAAAAHRRSALMWNCPVLFRRPGRHLQRRLGGGGARRGREGLAPRVAQVALRVRGRAPRGGLAPAGGRLLGHGARLAGQPPCVEPRNRRSACCSDTAPVLHGRAFCIHGMHKRLEACAPASPHVPAAPCSS